MQPTDSEVFHKYFEKCRKYRGSNFSMRNVNSYAGKHILEQVRKVHTTADEFEEFMSNVEIPPFPNSPDVFPIRLKKQYQSFWRTKVIP